MVNESIPMDDDDKKRKEINLNIITKKKQKNLKSTTMYFVHM